MKYWLSVIVILATVNASFSQNRKPKPVIKDSLSSEAFLKMVDETLNAYYAEYANNTKFDSIIDALEFEPNEIPEISDAVICERLAKMNEISPFQLDCNPITLSTIRFFCKSRRSFVKIVIGRSALYFDMYEEMLAKYDMPIDLKYLSVIESGLRPQVKSPAGALGLWQFMYGTGKMYGLKENAYIDERMNPAKSTDAACRFLKKLYDIYGDWNLALAAYNAGPGNVNKAIRRSGGKRTYWEVRPFLPRETQGYVPNFIAAAYLMTYHAEHNIVPAKADLHYYQLDTMCLTKGMHMSTISSLIDWQTEDIKTLNPVYKASYIPYTEPNQCISGPLAKIGKLVSMEDSLYALEASLYGPSGKLTPLPLEKVVSEDEEKLETSAPVAAKEFIYHKVRSGETLTKIARKYGVTNNEIMKVNKLRSTRVAVGKTLKIPTKKQNVPDVLPVPVKTDSTTYGTIIYDSVVSVFHTVQRNESLTVIAAKYNVTAEQIKTWNELKDNWLNIGQKLKIFTAIKLTKQGEIQVTEVKAVEIKQTPKVAPKVTPKEAPKKMYTVKSGDMFGRIAQKNGLTPAQLQKLNPSIKPDKISVGQQIRIK